MQPHSGRPIAISSLLISLLVLLLLLFLLLSLLLLLLVLLLLFLLLILLHHSKYAMLCYTMLRYIIILYVIISHAMLCLCYLYYFLKRKRPPCDPKLSRYQLNGTQPSWYLGFSNWDLVIGDHANHPTHIYIYIYTYVYVCMYKGLLTSLRCSSVIQLGTSNSKNV